MRLDGKDRQKIPWYDAEPGRLHLEQLKMRGVAPNLDWVTSFPKDSPAAHLGNVGGWQGRLPVWPFDRHIPKGVQEWLPEGMKVVIACSPAHPVVTPKIWPLDPEPGPEYRVNHSWHLNGDGTLCLFLDNYDWTGREFVSELVHKAAGWFLEYHLMKEDPDVKVMTSRGIACCDSFDSNLETLAAKNRG